jgi:hypothetical protein
MQAIIDTIVAFGKWILGLVKAVISAVWDFFMDGVCWVFDQVLSAAVSAIGGIDTSGVTSVGAWASLPADILNILGLLGFGQCMGIIAAAIGIRLVLQLIPFVRLGS